MSGPADWHTLAADLTAELEARGVLRDPALAAAFREVPRHIFAQRAEGSAADAPMSAAYTDRVIPTRFADTPGVVTPTSSLSQPTVVAMMLELLALGGDERVLEVGTGVGYNTALLCHRLGADRVTSVDITADLIEDARECLGLLGYRPILAVRDGAMGVPDRSPFDRVIVTCSLERVPDAWFDQLAPGAIVVTPLVHGGLLMTLTNDAGTLTGQAHPDGVYFVEMRRGETPPETSTPSTHRRVQLDVPVWELVSDEFAPWRELAVPGVAASIIGEEARLVGYRGHARLTPSPTGADVEEWGEPIVERVASEWKNWCAVGRPGRDRFGMTATRDRQVVWLDDADSAYQWEIPVCSR